MLRDLHFYFSLKQTSKSSKKGKGDDEDIGPPLIMNNGKDKRLKDEQELKVNMFS